MHLRNKPNGFILPQALYLFISDRRHILKQLVFHFRGYVPWCIRPRSISSVSGTWILQFTVWNVYILLGSSKQLPYSMTSSLQYRSMMSYGMIWWSESYELNNSTEQADLALNRTEKVYCCLLAECRLLHFIFIETVKKKNTSQIKTCLTGIRGSIDCARKGTTSGTVVLCK